MLDTKIGKACIAILVVIAATLGVLIWRGGKSPQRATPVRVAPADGAIDAIDAADAEIQNILVHAGKSRLVGVGKDGKRAYELNAESLEPLAEGRFTAETLHATVFLDGMQVRIAAPRADFTVPSEEEGPQAGRLEGGVTIELHRERRAGVATDPAPTDLALTITLDWITFDATLGQFETGSDVLFTSGRSSAELKGLTLRLSDAETRPRLLYAHAGPGSLRLFDDDDAGGRGPAFPSTPRAAAPMDARANPAAAALTEHFVAKLRGAVAVGSRGLEITGPAADLAMQLIDGRLPEGAIAQFRPKDGVPGRAGTGGGASGSPVDPVEQGADEPLVVAWDASLEVIAADLADGQARLAGELVRATFAAAEPAAPVRITHAETSTLITAASVDYGATTRALVLDPFEQSPIAATLPGLGHAELSRITLDLTKGAGTMHDGGVVTGEPSTERPGRSITWDGPATLAFDTSRGPVGAGGIVLPTSIHLADAVDMRDAEAIVTGASARAVFTSIDTPRGPEPRMSHASVSGSAAATWSEAGRVNADRLEVTFDPRADELTPIAAAAIGGVRGSLDDHDLAAESLDVTLVQIAGDAGDATTEVSDFHAAGAVVFEARSDGWRIDGEEITGNALDGFASVVGAPAVLSSIDTAEGGSIAGERIDVFEADQRLAVIGPGNATWALNQPTQATDYQRLKVTWSESMHYADAEGVARCEGAITFDGQVGADEHHAGSGQALVVRVRRAGESAGEPSTASRDVELSTVELIGPADGWATAEWRKRRTADDAADLTGLAELRGRTILADAQAQTVEVAGPGRLVALNNSTTEPGEAPSAPSPADAVSGDLSVRGTSIFEWQSGFSVNQRTGESVMHGGVKLRHSHAGSSAVTELDAARLAATFDAPEGGRANLRSFTADGAVLIRHDALQVVADHLTFAGDSDIAIASANPGNLVTIFDAESERHFNADSVEINLRTGEWVRKGGGIITAPR